MNEFLTDDKMVKAHQILQSPLLSVIQEVIAPVKKIQYLNKKYLSLSFTGKLYYKKYLLKSKKLYQRSKLFPSLVGEKNCFTVTKYLSRNEKK